MSTEEESDTEEYEGNNVAAMMAKANATDDPDEAARLMEDATREGTRQYINLQLLAFFMTILAIIFGLALLRELGL